MKGNATTLPPGEGGATALDLRGLKCPLPVLRTQKALGALPAGHVLEVHCSDPLATIDIPNLVRQQGDELLLVSSDGSRSTFRIRRREAASGRPAGSNAASGR